jgi:hypothetical protein
MPQQPTTPQPSPQPTSSFEGSSFIQPNNFAAAPAANFSTDNSAPANNFFNQTAPTQPLPQNDFFNFSNTEQPASSPSLDTPSATELVSQINTQPATPPREQPSAEERPMGEAATSNDENDSFEPGWLTPKVFKGTSIG